ncbi:2,3-dihydro-2,3-dihydroxybenzoate dehydrogenase [Actinokineospora xionganensis]|uniref:2,3-dihydro-2,3-dihydroxybenzoate dehydrogenase n=1 Tax=Actinokineospora xionganensis TaxID=2684470 RepID=A0ABR7KZW6_9PSEU|nr:2,3-dihydro-2,3-dihydroxybenzoate dehydrogenase [Actinokineospora xionganensis]MBC6445979.1 2,3-dihydro-2,3-dihydroxybenzoate dehydrogenase [Actinokineospora xionganensis]
MRGLEGKVAVVTGAAGGIGSAVASKLLSQGALVGALDGHQAGLDALADRLGGDRDRLEFVTADVTSGEAVDAAVDRVERRFGGIDFLVNTAGVLRTGHALDLSEEDWVRTFDVNTKGVFLASRAAARKMVERKQGAIVTVASNAANVPRTSMAAYGASKAASIAFTKTLALELSAFHVRCNVVSPGSTDTSMMRALWTGADGAADAIVGSPGAFRVGIPLGKIAQPDDIADAVVFLLSDAANHITMQELCVDGGAALGA